MAPSCANNLRTVPAFVHFNRLCSFLSAPSKSYKSTTLPIDTVLPSDTFHFKIFMGLVCWCEINTVFSAIFTGYGRWWVFDDNVLIGRLKAHKYFYSQSESSAQFLNQKNISNKLKAFTLYILLIDK